MKRLTDADKWADPWFGQLDPLTKLFWIYLLDNVDNAGVWEKFEKKFQFETGIGISIDALIEDLGDRVFDLGDKILVPKFVTFQQGGELSESKGVHRGIFRLLEKHGLEQDDSGKVCHTNGISMPYPSHSDAIPMPCLSHTDGIAMASSNSNSNSNSNIRGSAEGDGKRKKGKESAWPVPEELNTPEFREAWDAYLAMRKENKWATLKPSSLKARFKEFKEHGIEESIRALEESVRQGWRGVFPGNQQAGQHDDNDRNYEDGV